MVWKQKIFTKDQTWKREDVVDFEEQTNDVPKSEYEAHSMELKDNITFESVEFQSIQPSSHMC